MKISILSLFPEMFSVFNSSLIKRATDKNLLQINCIDIRDYSQDKHQKCDDYTFGGGAGMIMMPQPIHDAIMACDPLHNAHRIYMSPKGRTLNQKTVMELSKYEEILLLCGHYEGVDQRVIDLDIDEEISIGDYVLTGGEIPAMALVDAVSRYVDGVLGSSHSTEEESFSAGTLEYPQYTRPQVFMGISVPEVLINGNHQLVDKWRTEQSDKVTREKRPDLLVDNNK